MSFVTLILVYVIVWWLVFFAALPFGVRAQHENDNELSDGTDPGAPTNPKLKKKAIITSLIAALLTTLYYFVATSGLIDFRG